MSQYPEHDKLHSVQVQKQAVGDFLIWLLEEQKVMLSKPHEHEEYCFDDGERVCGTANGVLVPVSISVRGWLARLGQSSRSGS
jgi:hypothetical protein